ncbi:Fatty acyl-CoA reductase wat [Fusarium oxysporum f. sp. albedinis]|nr:Fatty acyl-CoA reductase wat [Fusarium oxysporum f. sp. albedinis]
MAKFIKKIRRVFGRLRGSQQDKEDAAYHITRRRSSSVPRSIFAREVGAWDMFGVPKTAPDSCRDFRTLKYAAPHMK